MKTDRYLLFSPTVILWLKRILAILLVSILFYQIINHGDLKLWWVNFTNSWKDAEHKEWLILCVLLMPLNWFLETTKWRLLLRHNWQASWLTIGKSILAGISVSLVTPNRIGEYGGRAILAPKKQLATVVMTTFIGNICQWLAFICCGWPAFIYLLNEKQQWTTHWFIILAIAIPVTLLSMFFWGSFFFRWLQKQKLGQHKKWIRWARLKMWTIKHIRFIDLFGAWLLALLRLFVYSFQYLLLLWFFNIPLSFWLGVSGIFSIFLIQAGIPLPPGLGVITRSELAIWIWGSKLINPISVLSATFSLYLINLVIPALLGSWLIVKKENSKP